MSWLSKSLGIDSRRNKVNQDRNQLQSQIDYEQNGGGFTDAFNSTAGAFLQNAMPDFRKSLQLTREDGIRRGISTGDLGTSTEGDLTSAFQRNIANALGGLAMQGYEGSRNRVLDLLSGKTGIDINDLNEHMNMLGGLFSGFSQLAASAFGARGGAH